MANHKHKALEVLRLTTEGYSQQEAAERVGISARTVRRWKRRFRDDPSECIDCRSGIPAGHRSVLSSPSSKNPALRHFAVRFRATC